MSSKVQLVEVTTKIGSGSTPKGGKSSYLEFGPFKLIRSQNVYNHYFSKDGLAYISEEQAIKLNNVELMKEDILINITGDSVARVTMVNDEMLPGRVNQHVSIIRCNYEKLYPQFLLAVLTSNEMQRNLLSLAQVGGTRAALTKGMLEKLEIDVLDLEKQKYIGDTLKFFNLKIENNINIIQKLEELSQTIFKRWFIDFEFPNEEGLPYKSSGGKMMDSELGEIPEGWNIEYLSSSTEFLSGGTPKTKESAYWNGDIPFFTPKDVGSSAYTTNTEKTITELGLSKCNSRLYPKNTVFITARGTVGKVALANRDMAMNQSCFALKSRNGSQFYLYGAIKTLLREIIQGATGAVFNAINLSDLNRLRLAMPQQELIDKYEAIAITLFDQMSALEFENINLQILRDTLLPKLLSGEIEIPDESVVV